MRTVGRNRCFVPMLVLTFVAVAPYPAAAQRMRLQAAPGPHYVGDAVDVQIVVDGLEASPDPELDIGAAADGLNVTFLGLSPQTSRSITIINGRRTDTSTVRYIWRYQITAQREGSFTWGPFTARQGANEVTHRELSWAFAPVGENPNMSIEVAIPEGPLYVGQVVPIEVIWRYAGDLNAVTGQTIRSDLFDAFDFEDNRRTPQDDLLMIEEGGERKELQAEYRRASIDDRPFIVGRATRRMYLDQEGSYSFAGPTAVIRLGRRGEYVFEDLMPPSLFGRSGGSRRARSGIERAMGNAIEFQVLPIPTEGRPSYFSGAVGTGFQLEVASNRSVVHVGDPIQLTVTVRGNGNLRGLGCPPLVGAHGLSGDLFQVPSGEVAGVRTESTKQFQRTIRATDVGATSIPPITFAWFDTDSGTYRTTSSAPIALDIQSAEAIGAEQVVASSSLNAADPPASQESARPSPPTKTLMDNVDYAITLDIPQLLAPPNNRRWGGMAIGCYGGAAALAALAAWNLRPSRSPRSLRARADVEAWADRLEATAALPLPLAAREVADILRALLENADSAERQQIGRLMERCDVIAYAPANAQAEQPLDRDLGDQVAALIERRRKRTAPDT